MIKTQGRIPSLDGLRGLAILLVMLHHFTLYEPGSGLEAGFVKIMHFGGFGVDLFFVLSGFLITGILLDAKGSPHYFKNFYARRALRIFPLYYTFLFCAFFLAPPLLAHLPFAGPWAEEFDEARRHGYWYVFYLSNFWIASKGFFGRGGLDISWSLAIEEHFYLIWPSVLRRLQIRQVIKLCLSLIAGVFLIRCLLWKAGFKPLQIYVLTFSRLDSLALGALVAALSRDAGPAARRALSLAGHPVLLPGSFLALSVLGILGGLDFQSAFLQTAGYSLIGIFFTQILVHLLRKETGLLSRTLTHPFFVRLGKYSYAIYLFHIPLSAAAREILGIEHFQGLPGPALLWQIGFYMMMTPLTVLAAWISWQFLEKPALDLKRFFPMQRPVRTNPRSSRS